ncbi:MAG: serine/threonine-protein kinase [Streptosporangiaceae bacterium]
MTATSAEHQGAATSGDDSIGPYRLAEVLGEGGMGVVRRGTDPAGRTVAVKVLRPAAAGDATALRRLAREVDTMRRVRSPFVAQIIDADVTADPPYIVTHYVQGRTLEQTVEERGPLEGTALKRLAEGLAEALAAIHAAGIVHRDLKPGNVMFNAAGDPILIDFGIAMPVDATRLTSAGMVIGTPGYLAPEIISGEEARAPADVHSWAGTLIYAATGRPPFGNGTFEVIFYKIMQGTPDLTGVPAPILPVLRSAMAQHPAERPTAKDLAHLVGRLDLEMTMIDHTLIDHRARPQTSPMPAPPRPVQEIPVQEIPVQRVPVQRLPQPRDFHGQLPPVAPPPPSPPPFPPLTGPRSYERQPQTAPRQYPSQQPPRPQNYGLPPDQGQGQGQSYPTVGDRTQERAQRRTDPNAPKPPKPYGWYRVIGLLLLVAVLGLTYAVPVTALGVVVVVVIVLRAGDRSAKALESKRTRRGPRSGDVVGAVVKTPLALPRALLTTALVTPIGLAVGCVVLGVLLTAGLAGDTSVTSAMAITYSLMVVNGLQFVGPGGTASRRQLARIWGAVLPRREPAMLAAFCVGVGVAVLIGLVSQSDPDLTPISGVAGQLDSFRSTVSGWTR